MKIIGKTEDGFIAEVTKYEIYKYFNTYYHANRDYVKVGDEYDLGKGHDFMIAVKENLKTTQKFIESNKGIIESILSGIALMDNLAKKSEQEDK